MLNSVFNDYYRKMESEHTTPSDEVNSSRPTMARSSKSRKKRKCHAAEIDKMLDGIKFIADHLREADEDDRVSTVRMRGSSAHLSHAYIRFVSGSSTPYFLYQLVFEI